MKNLIALTLLFTIFNYGCANKKDSSYSTDLISKDERNSLNKSPTTDAEITNTIMTANAEEMHLASIGKKKGMNPMVKQYSQKMLEVHGKNVRMNHQVAKEFPQKTISTLEFKFTTEDKIEELKKLEGKKFDKAFMDAQVNLHEKVLSKLDDKLIPNAKDGELRTMLQQTRGNVEMHLQEAKNIQKKL